MHTRSKSSHYTQPQLVRNKLFVNNTGPCPCPCDDCQRRNRTRNNTKLVVNPQRDPIADAVAKLNALSASLKSSARGDDDDPRQIIADLISDDRSPYMPEDEQALRFMSTPTLKEMRRTYLKANSHTPPVSTTQLANRDFSFGAGAAGADFARRQTEGRMRANAYIARNPAQRAQRVAVTNSNDPAVQAMSANTGAVAHLKGQ